MPSSLLFASSLLYSHQQGHVILSLDNIHKIKLYRSTSLTSYSILTNRAPSAGRSLEIPSQQSNDKLYRNHGRNNPAPISFFRSRLSTASFNRCF